MDIKKSDRATLKLYFVKNAIPTAGNFAEVIDSVLNQKDDGIVKLPGEPLSVQAEGDDASQKRAINFYRNFADPKPAWTLSLNPRANPTDPRTARPGWGIGDGDGVNRLFIDQATGNVGVGTVDPGNYKLNVNGSVLITGNCLWVTSENAGRLRVGAVWGIPGLYSSDDGPQPLALCVHAGQKVYLGEGTTDAFVEGGTGNAYFKGNVGIGTNAPSNKLQIAGNLHMDGNSIFFRTNPADRYDVIRWNEADDRLHVGGFNGVVLGYTRGGPSNVITPVITPVITVDTNGIVQQAWQPVSFQNGWRNYGQQYNTAGYFKDSMGMVHLKGLIAGGRTPGIAIFNLPAGYRPVRGCVFGAGTCSEYVGRVDVFTNGDVVAGSGTDKEWTTLDGITFRAEG